MTPFTDFVEIKSGRRIDLIGVEVGVRDGVNAIELLNGLPIKKLYLVDSFSPYQDGTVRYYTRLQQEEEYFKLLNNIDDFSDRTIIVRQTSKWARRLFPDKDLDFVYIDANHAYRCVKDDLKWWDYLKVGGILGGHDYGGPWGADVAKAVDRFVAERQLKVDRITLDTSRNGVEWGIVKMKP